MKFIFLTLILLISGCAVTPFPIDRGDYKADQTHPAVAQNERIRFLVFHYTALDDQKSIDVLTGPNVSAHYLAPTVPAIDNGKPVALQMVAEEKRAWHAGVSNWGNRSNLNDTSIGIEIVNPGYTDEGAERRWYDYAPGQMDLIGKLALDIISRYQIAPENVLAHSDIAPQRKYDPGPRFPWQALSRQGIGAWPDELVVEKYLAGRLLLEPASVANIQAALEEYGYTVPQTGVLDEETRKVISAFQMHFRPQNIRGDADAQTEAIALALVEKYKKKN
ncbi:negative regulator of beta-lactamase expression [Herbaspirillum sp. CF444]|uniref:N-acetylmuramoyl-L-alanine amidase n=1 Tax=Herbaspirillum sp. CF444 TaxID=1144319 RepID=UPI0002722D94|nr:N-acetylmuramoyl-L-alanine amidase [Herbaspirillum sp. CF444]EJL88725.1 negative regulator of beta-lactamase expression [Herbaspirillum sp. CF444]